MNTFNSQATLKVDNAEFDYFSLESAEKAGAGPVSKLPFSLKVMLENLLRFEDGQTVSADDIRVLASSPTAKGLEKEIAFRPARVLMQDFTGVPAIVDLATMRDEIKHLGGDPRRINPLQQVDLVIDHSVQVDQFGTPAAFAFNADRELERNRERYVFLKWGQKAFQNCRVVPPDVGTFVESYGPGLSSLSLADRATIANMSPEYGATIGFFPIDSETLNYLRLTGREPDHVKLVEAYAKAQGLFRTESMPDPIFGDTLELDLSSVEPSLAGPRRPQDRVPLAKAKQAFREALPSMLTKQNKSVSSVAVSDDGKKYDVAHGSVVIAAITS